MLLKRLVASLAVFFGFLGVGACIPGIYAVWSVGSRLDRANEKVFATVDDSLTAARDRVLGVQQRVQESKLTTDEIGKQLRDWAARQAAERVGSRLEIEGKAEKLAQKLQQADAWLETANESIRVTQQVLETANAIGAPVDAAFVEDAVEKLSSLQSKLQQAQTSVDGIHDLVAKFDDVASQKERADRAVRLVARVIITISEIDTRLGELADRLSEVRASTGQLKASTRHYIVGATGVAFVLIAWMAAGQVTLCLYGWKNCRRSREHITASDSSPSRSPAG